MYCPDGECRSFLILTQDDQMITTPTYHVFDMYAAHEEGQSLPIWITSKKISYRSPDRSGSLPSISGSVSKKGKKVTLSLVNLHATETIEIRS